MRRPWRVFGHQPGPHRSQGSGFLSVAGGAVKASIIVRFDPVDDAGPPPMKADLVWVWPVAGSMGAFAGARRWGYPWPSATPPERGWVWRKGHSRTAKDSATESDFEAPRVAYFVNRGFEPQGPPACVRRVCW